MPHGKLDVYAEGAVQIKDSTILGKGSPYCTLTIGTQVFSSPPVPEGGTHPYFNTKFEFQVDRTTEQLIVTIFSKKTLMDDDLLGYCTIDFKDVFYHGHVVPVTPYALTRPSGRPGGHIRLALTFKSHTEPAAPPAGGYMPPQPTPGSYRQPRPVGPPRGPQYRPRPPQNFPAGPSTYPPPHNLPHRTDEDSGSQSSRSDSDSDFDGLKAPFPHPPPGPRPRPPGPTNRRGPPPIANKNAQQIFGGANHQQLHNLGGEFVGSEESGGDESYGHVETTSFGSAPEEEHHNDAVVEVEYAEAYERDEGEISDYGAGARGFGPPAAGAPGARGRGRGRAGPPGRGRAGPPGRAGMMPGRGGRGRGPPMARGGPPGMRGRAAAPF